ncbi:MAG: DUF1932 domain-containing protein [Chloroflexota bacterium]
MNIGILNPGTMGVAVAQTMVNSGHRVYWVSAGRSAETHRRAESVPLQSIGSLLELADKCPQIVSVVPPHAAEEVADRLLSTGWRGVYLDANAISPQKSKEIGAKMKAAGSTYIDGGIIGMPPRQRGQTCLHLAGPEAKQTADWFLAGPLDTQIVSQEIGSASALKMCFAAYTKGTTALFTAILSAAKKLDVVDELAQEWERFGDGFMPNAENRVTRIAHTKAWRFAGEMEEMATTWEGLDMPNGFFQGAAETYRRIGHLRAQPEMPSLVDVAEALMRPE